MLLTAIMFYLFVSLGLFAIISEIILTIEMLKK